MPYALPRSTPESQGVPSAAMLAFLRATQQQALELHSFMLVRHGYVVAEGWLAPYAAEHPYQLYSLSKSFASTAIGLAVAEERLSIDDSVIAFFSNEASAEPSQHLAAMRVRHLLSMSTGHQTDIMNYLFQREDGNWIKGFFDAPVEHEPGTHFAYNSAATFMLSAIIQKLTGTTLLDYLRPRLLEPLGIETATWQTNPQGVNVGGWGMSIATESIAKFGLLYLQRGEWHGAQLIPAAWVDEATRSHISNGNDPNSDWNQGYGFQFWRCRHNSYRGDGAFGQFCVVMPKQDAVIAITAGVNGMQSVLDLVWQHVLPAMHSGTLPEDTASQRELASTLAQWALPLPTGEQTTATAARVSGCTYSFAANDLKIEAITCAFHNGTGTLTIRDNRGAHRVVIGWNQWHRGTTTFVPSEPHRVAAAGAWTSENTYSADLTFYESPHRAQITCQFVEDRMLFDLCMNVSFGPTHFPQLVGRAE